LAGDLKPIQNYIHAIKKALAAGDATEHLRGELHFVTTGLPITGKGGELCDQNLP